jgi:2-polyprenyl-3-methyl-5-hydroxy-6-metoxy-1,4-benzoquinol methylase
LSRSGSAEAFVRLLGRLLRDLGLEVRLRHQHVDDCHDEHEADQEPESGPERQRFEAGQRAEDTTPPYADPSVASVKDPDGAEIRALGRLFDFSGKRVLEVGSGDGRLTWRYAGATQSVLGIEPDAEAVAVAQADIPPDLTDRVSFRVLDATELDEPPGRFDAAFLSWSLC